VNDLDGDEVIVDATAGEEVEKSTKVAKKEVSTADPISTTEDVEVTIATKRVKKLERNKKSRNSGLKRLWKVGSTTRVESSEDTKNLGDQEDASKQGRIIDTIYQVIEITLVDETQGRMNEEDMFGVNDLDGDEVIVDATAGKIEGDKPPKDKGISSVSEENDIDQYDPLFLHSNDTNGVPIICFKLKDKLKEHNQLLKLKQFLMGLDEVHAPIRIIILTTYPIPDVKGAFSSLSRVESEKFVFIGYSNDKKGYKLFSIESKKVFYPKDETRSSEPYVDRRDKEPKISEGTYHMSSKGTKNIGHTRRDERKCLDDSEPAEVVTDIEESATLVESDKESEGDDSFYQAFNEMFEIPNMVPDSQSEVNLRRFGKLSTRLVAKGYNQKEGVDYDETFSPVVKIVTVRCILSLSVFNGWSVYQLDVNNAFLYSDLEEDVYMSLPEGYFYKDDKRVYRLRKYCFKLLTEFGMLACKPCGTPIDSTEGVVKHSKGKVADTDYPLTWINNYQKISHLKLAFRVLRYLKAALGKEISFNNRNDLNLRVHVDSDWAKCNVTKKSVTGYVVFMGKTLISWKSKKQSMLFKSSSKAEYRARIV
nr:ribonuclease H-like domain-containing protein [Tanacetum cinerariifolium]